MKKESDLNVSFYNKQVVDARSSFFNRYRQIDESTPQLLSLAVDAISKIKEPKVLDIGTGNGFVLKEIAKMRPNKQIELYGIDSSENMIQEAVSNCSEYSQIKLIRADNYNIPFEDGYFDVVTNKLCPDFSFEEILRVLKEDGIFIFKEYGLSRGLGVVADVFKGRVKAVDPILYIKQFRENHPKSLIYTQYFIEKHHTESEIQEILEMAPLVTDFDSEKDIRKIRPLFTDGKISIVADPFILVVRK